MELKSTGLPIMQYHFSIKILHWVMGTLFILMLCDGFWMHDLSDAFPGKYDVLYPMHKSFGILLAVLIVMRIILRVYNPVPKLPTEINKFDANLSGITIFLLYVCMVTMVVSGYLMSAFGAHAIPFFGVFDVPLIVETNHELSKDFNKIHKYIGFTFAILIGLHFLGAMKHYFVDKINLFNRM